MNIKNVLSSQQVFEVGVNSNSVFCAGGSGSLLVLPPFYISDIIVTKVVIVFGKYNT